MNVIIDPQFITDLTSSDSKEITLFYIDSYITSGDKLSVVSDKINDFIYIFELSRYTLITKSTVGGYFPNLNGYDNKLTLYYRYKGIEDNSNIDELRKLCDITEIPLYNYSRNIFTFNLLKLSELGVDGINIIPKILTNKGCFIYDNNNSSINDKNTRQGSGNIYQHYHHLMSYSDKRNINNTYDSDEIFSRIENKYINTICPLPEEEIFNITIDPTNEGYYFYNNDLYVAGGTNTIFDPTEVGDVLFSKTFSNDSNKLNSEYISNNMSTCTQEIYSFVGDYDHELGEFIISLSGYNLNPVASFTDSESENMYILLSEDLT